MQNHDKLAYTINEACQAIGLGRSSLYRLVREDKLKIIKIGERSLIPATALQRLVEEAEAA